jgi:hypothetical protein
MEMIALKVEMARVHRWQAEMQQALLLAKTKLYSSAIQLNEQRASYYNIKAYAIYLGLVGTKAIGREDFAVPNLSTDDIDIAIPTLESVRPYKLAFLSIDRPVGKKEMHAQGRLPKAPDLNTSVMSWASNESTLEGGS